MRWVSCHTMPDPQTHPYYDEQRQVAFRALVCSVGIMLLKFGVFYYTNSAAVLTDALESVINIVASGFLLYSVWLSNRPADREHPYGHGKVEFMTVGLEGWLILVAAVTVLYESFRRFFQGDFPAKENLTIGAGMLLAVGILSGLLAGYVYFKGKEYQSDVLLADGKHLFTDVGSTAGVFVGLLVVQYTGWMWLDPLIAIGMAALILYTSWNLLWQSFHGLMDRQDAADDTLVRQILDDETTKGTIKGYHKLRMRHSGRFHWVDLHLQVPGDMTVRESHALASKIEYRIEQALGEGQANATAHVEPAEEQAPEATNTSDAIATAQTPGIPPIGALSMPPQASPLSGAGGATARAKRPSDLDDEVDENGQIPLVGDEPADGEKKRETDEAKPQD